MARPSKRSSLACLTKKRLITLARELGLDVAQSEPKDTFVDAIAGSKSASFERMLEQLSLTELLWDLEFGARVIEPEAHGLGKPDGLDSPAYFTKTYNALKDPNNTDAAILELRRLTETMDRAVLDAYGWTDLEVPPYCPKTKAEQAAHKVFEDEVIRSPLRPQRRASPRGRAPGPRQEGQEAGKEGRQESQTQRRRRATIAALNLVTNTLHLNA